MNQQTIHLPSGVSVTISAPEPRPLSALTDVEIHEQLESLAVERRKVQGHRDEEAVQVRAVAKSEAKRLRGELQRRKRENVKCPACDGVGTYGCDRDTRIRIYCDGCEKGIRLYLESVDSLAESLSEWLKYPECHQPDESSLESTEALLQEKIAERDRLIGLLDLLRAR